MSEQSFLTSLDNCIRTKPSCSNVITNSFRMFEQKKHAGRKELGKLTQHEIFSWPLPTKKDPRAGFDPSASRHHSRRWKSHPVWLRTWKFFQCRKKPMKPPNQEGEETKKHQAPALYLGLSHIIATSIWANTFLLTRQVTHRNFTPDLRSSPPQKHRHCVQALPFATKVSYLPVSWQSSHASTHRSLHQQVSLSLLKWG